jgi:glycosyltransferase involved in cell wall biosynthesis
VRIALVTHQFFPAFYTGVERLTLNLAMQLRTMGHECVVVTSAPHSSGSETPYTFAGIDVVPVETVRTELARPWLYDRQVASPLRRALDGAQVDLVHVMSPIRVSQAFEQARLRGLPVVAHVPDFAYFCARLQFVRSNGDLCAGADEGHACVAACGISAGPERVDWGRRLLAGAAAVVSPSRFAIAVHAAHGFETSTWRHIPWGVDYALHTSRLPAPTGEGLTVGFIGTLLSHKGPHLLLEALRLLPGRDIRIVLYGASFHERAYEEKLRKLAGGDPRVTFAGSYEHGDLRDVLAPLDVVAIPSLWHENLPTAGLNGAASGVPVVGSDVEGIRELIEDYRCGLTFRTGDSADLAATLEEFLVDPSVLERIRRGMAYPPSLEEEAFRLEGVYEEVLGAVSR